VRANGPHERAGAPEPARGQVDDVPRHAADVAVPNGLVGRIAADPEHERSAPLACISETSLSNTAMWRSYIGIAQYSVDSPRNERGTVIVSARGGTVTVTTAPARARQHRAEGGEDGGATGYPVERAGAGAVVEDADQSQDERSGRRDSPGEAGKAGMRSGAGPPPGSIRHSVVREVRAACPHRLCLQVFGNRAGTVGPGDDLGTWMTRTL
jgi:hypothetical protein